MKYIEPDYLPTQAEIDRSISVIIESTTIKKQNFLYFFIEQYKGIGVRNILHDSADVFGVSLILYLLMAAPFLSLVGYLDVYNCHLFFLVSPFLFQIISLLSDWKDRNSELDEIKQVCKYTPHRLRILRMPIFSGFTLVVNICISSVWCIAIDSPLFFQLIAVSVCALFLYGLLDMFISYANLRYSHIYSILIWFIANLFILKLCMSMKVLLFVTIPLYVHIVTGTVVLLVFFYVLQKAYTRPRIVTV